MNLLEEEQDLEEQTNKYNLKPFLREKGKAYSESFDSEYQELVTELHAQLLLYKRMTIPMAVGVLLNRTNLEEILNFLDWVIDNSIELWDKEKEQIVIKEPLEPEEETKLHQFKYPLPMVVKPEKLERNSDTGYMFSAPSSIICRRNTPDFDVNLDHINRVNSVAYDINLDVVNNTKAKRENMQLSDRKYVQNQNIIASALSGVPIYFTHKYDKRGRFYPVGYYLNYQGDDKQKAMLFFHKKSKLEP